MVFIYLCVLMNDEQHKYTVLHPKKFDDSPTNFHFFQAFLEVVYIQRERERREKREKRERTTTLSCMRHHTVSATQYRIQTSPDFKFSRILKNSTERERERERERFSKNFTQISQINNVSDPYRVRS